MKKISQFCGKNLFTNNNTIATLIKFPRFNFNTSLFPTQCQSIINNKMSFYTLKYANFAKGGSGKNDKKAKKEKEKENIHKEYQGMSTDELKAKYKTKFDNVLVNFKEALAEIRVQRSNPKILDGIVVIIKGKRNKLSELATIMLKSANVLVINPFDESHRDSIIKSIETSKLDVQVTTEAGGIVVTLGAIPDDMKTECTQKVKKLFESARDQMKELRQGYMGEVKKLEKILGQDEAKRLEKGMSENLEK
jgi:ribosome recycling factor